MRVLDKLPLIDKICRELQSRFTFSDLIPFLQGYLTKVRARILDEF